MKTDLNYIKKLLKILETNEINEIEIEEEGTRVRVVKTKPQDSSAAGIYLRCSPAAGNAASRSSGCNYCTHSRN